MLGKIRRKRNNPGTGDGSELIKDNGGNFMRLNNVLAPYHREHQRERSQIFSMVQENKRNKAKVERERAMEAKRTQILHKLSFWSRFKEWKSAQRLKEEAVAEERRMLCLWIIYTRTVLTCKVLRRKIETKVRHKLLVH